MLPLLTSQKVGGAGKAFPTFISKSYRLQIILKNRTQITYSHSNCLELTQECPNTDITVTRENLYFRLNHSVGNHSVGNPKKVGKVAYLVAYNLLTGKSSREWAPRLSLRFSALYMVCCELIIKFCSSSVSMRSLFHTMPLSVTYVRNLRLQKLVMYTLMGQNDSHWIRGPVSPVPLKLNFL